MWPEPAGPALCPFGQFGRDIHISNIAPLWGRRRPDARKRKRSPLRSPPPISASEGWRFTIYSLINWSPDIVGNLCPDLSSKKRMPTLSAECVVLLQFLNYIPASSKLREAAYELPDVSKQRPCSRSVPEYVSKLSKFWSVPDGCLPNSVERCSASADVPPNLPGFDRHQPRRRSIARTRANIVRLQADFYRARSVSVRSRPNPGERLLFFSTAHSDPCSGRSSEEFPDESHGARRPR